MKIELVAAAGMRTPHDTLSQFNYQMEELNRLIQTAGGSVQKEYIQVRPRPDSATFLGKGKIEEISSDMKKMGIKTLVFNDDLSVAQQKNIEKQTAAKVIDRTRLILDIFAQRARTKEGQLQIELAQLTYMVPRLTGAWRGYSQQMGGIGTRGPGERKIEVERRYVRDRIKKLKEEINEIHSHRERIREGRRLVPLPQMSLIGYTNVGKSTLLNKLVGENTVYADDKLFATLDPTTRRIKLPGGRTVLFTDTVGFIQKLPHSLVAAFKATLEEVSQSTLLVHVVDGTAENRENQIKTVLDVVKELGGAHLPLLTVVNKSDALSKLEKQRLSQSGARLISAKTGEGLNEFLKDVEEKLDTNLVDVSFELPHSKRNLLSDIYKTGRILSQKPQENGVRLHVRIDPANWERLSHYLKNEPPIQ